MIIDKGSTVLPPQFAQVHQFMAESRKDRKARSESQTAEEVRVEEPPPYMNNPRASASAPSLPQPSAISSPLPTPPPLPPRSPRPPNPAKNATNYVYAKTRHEPITGLYNIDPELDAVALGKEGVSAHERRHYNQKHQQKHRHHTRKGPFKPANLPDPNAIFETRHGSIALDLGIVAGPVAWQSRARVQAKTKHGDININVRTVHAQRFLNLEVSSRKGNVHILIPRSFSGYIQLHSNKGSFTVLPRLAADMELVYRRDSEMQIIAGRAIEASAKETLTSWTGDTMHVSSRQGNVTIGYLGEDPVSPTEPGFWNKLTEFFHN